MARPPTDPFGKLVEALRKLPGVGRNGAQRMALHILRAQKGFAAELAARIVEVAEKTIFCSRCQNIASSDPCDICSDTSRDASILCVVEEPSDLTAIEKTGAFDGLYFVLHGALSPLEGVGPADVRVERLIERAKEGGTKEVVLATNPDAEGEATAHYVAARIEPLGIKVTRLARGLPAGGDLRYVDEATIEDAISGRRIMSPSGGASGKRFAKKGKF